MWELLTDPNLAYGLLLAALLFTALAVLTPGTGFLEIMAIGLWVFAALVLSTLPLRGWAIALLLVALVPLWLALRRPEKRRWMALTIGLFLVSALAMVRPEEGWLAVHPLWAALGGALFASILWWGSVKVFEALHRPPLMHLDHLIGQVGVTRTPVYREGSVYVAGEIWSARSESPIPAGRRVRVLRREGLVLWVAPETEHPNTEEAAP